MFFLNIIFSVNFTPSELASLFVLAELEGHGEFGLLLFLYPATFLFCLEALLRGPCELLFLDHRQTADRSDVAVAVLPRAVTGTLALPLAKVKFFLEPGRPFETRFFTGFVVVHRERRVVVHRPRGLAREGVRKIELVEFKVAVRVAEGVRNVAGDALELTIFSRFFQYRKRLGEIGLEAATGEGVVVIAATVTRLEAERIQLLSGVVRVPGVVDARLVGKRIGDVERILIAIIPERVLGEVRQLRRRRRRRRRSEPRPAGHRPRRHGR